MTTKIKQCPRCGKRSPGMKEHSDRCLYAPRKPEPYILSGGRPNRIVENTEEQGVYNRTPRTMNADNDRCQRWRKIAIEQFGYVLNLTLTFAIATLGYCFALLKDKDFAPVIQRNRL